MSVTIQEMLESGVHFGHQTSRWNPAMGQYIFGERNGIHIIDLQKTLPLFERAYQFAMKVSSRGGSILFVATKKQAQDVVIEAAKSCGMYHMTHRWLGGTLTNFRTVKQSIDRLRKLEPMILPVQVQNQITTLLNEETQFISEMEVVELQRLLSQQAGSELTDAEFTQLKEMARQSAENGVNHDALRTILEPKLVKMRQATTLSKKELLKMSREYEKLNNSLGGIKDMKELPKAIFIVDINKEHIAVAEARRLNIPTIAIVDTNTNPQWIDFPIPGNDDAIRAIQLFASKVAEAANEGRNYTEKDDVVTAGSDEELTLVVEDKVNSDMPAPEASASAEA